jgi:hypothetical protein
VVPDRWHAARTPIAVSEIGLHPVGIYDSPWRRSEGVFLQPRRFPEYLRLQNIRDRVDDIHEIGARPNDDPARDGWANGAARDATLAKIGEVLPVDQSERAGGLCDRPCPATPPASTTSIDGLGRMIDTIA